MIPVRLILAMDIGLHGERFIVIEFTLVTLFAAALGLFELVRADATPTYTLSGVAFMGIAASALTACCRSATCGFDKMLATCVLTVSSPIWSS